MSNIAKTNFIALCLTVLLTGCAQDADDAANTEMDSLGPGEVAFVDGVRIPESIFRLYTLESVQTDADNLTPEGREEMINRLIALQALTNEAERNGLHEERRIAAELELLRITYLARAMTQRYSEDNPPSESELRALYQENLPRFQNTEYKTSHILVDTEAEANQLISELDQGADFGDLAREHSTDTASGQDGGDLGWATPDTWVQPFAEAVRNTPAGTYTPAPVESQYGWHIIRVEEIAEDVAPGLDAVRQDLIVAAQNQKLNEFVQGLTEAAEVVVVDE